MENQNTNLNSWEDFKGNWLKPANIKDLKEFFVVMKVESDLNPDGKEQVVLTLNVYNKKKKLSLNQANIKACEEKGIISPKALEMKAIKFGTMKVYSPSEKKQVLSLIIEEIK